MKRNIGPRGIQKPWRSGVGFQPSNVALEGARNRGHGTILQGRLAPGYGEMVALGLDRGQPAGAEQGQRGPS